MMTMGLYAATVPQFLQIVGAAQGLLARAEAFCAEQNRAPDTILEARLAPDMLPFPWQVRWVGDHSAGALAGVRAGLFTPNSTPPANSFAALAEGLAKAKAELETADPAEIDGWEERDVTFAFGERRIPFTGAGFLTSFSLPNLHFHATTTYAILRNQGVPLGKIDYLGQMRIKD